MTKKEKELYDFVSNYIADHEISPTLPEIGQAIGFSSKGAISRYINNLINKGYLKKGATGYSRNIMLTNKFLPQSNCHVQQHIPLVGSIAAGLPIEAIEDNTLNINDIIKGNNLFMLKVKGNSMIEDGIFDGDYVICEQAQTAKEGDTIVALIEQQEATLKRYYLSQNPGKILLCPANSNMSPIEVDAKDLAIQGILRCQLREH